MYREGQGGGVCREGRDGKCVGRGECVGRGSAEEHVIYGDIHVSVKQLFLRSVTTYNQSS